MYIERKITPHKNPRGVTGGKNQSCKGINCFIEPISKKIKNCPMIQSFKYLLQKGFADRNYLTMLTQVLSYPKLLPNQMYRHNP